MPELIAQFPLLISKLSPRQLQNLADALVLLDLKEGEGSLRKFELEAIKYPVTTAVEHAWKELIREPFFHAGRWNERTDAEKKLDDVLGVLVYPHLIGGWLKKVEAAEAAAGPMRDAMLALLREIAPLCARVTALKNIIGKKAPAPSKTAMAAAERTARAMTCQCCARDILAETGVIAHHGYQRPAGTGYQTASCPGARELPFEVSRDALGRYIENLEAYVVRQDAYRTRVQGELVELPFKYNDRSACTQSWHRGVERLIHVSRATMPVAIETALAAGFKTNMTFDTLKAWVIGNVTSDIEHTEALIAQQKRRWHGWTKTHERVGEEWKAVA